MKELMISAIVVLIVAGMAIFPILIAVNIVLSLKLKSNIPQKPPDLGHLA
jgi:hypothetical protein